MISEQTYQQWYGSLDAIDREIYNNVVHLPDDDYPLAVTGQLSRAAAERAGLYQSEAGPTAVYCPVPPAEYFAALRVEKQEKAKTIEDKAAFNKQEGNREEQWRNRQLAGLVSTTVYPATLASDRRQPHYWQGKLVVRFHTNRFGTDSIYYPWAADMWLHSYGNASVLYVRPEQAAIWWREKWEQTENKPFEVWNILDSHLTGYSTYGSQFAEFIYEDLGEAALLDLARLYRPRHRQPYAFLFGLVSKAYRLVVDSDKGPGFGDPGDTRESIDERWLDAESSHFLWRLTGWIPLEAQTSEADWPTSADLELRKQQVQSYSSSI